MRDALAAARDWHTRPTVQLLPGVLSTGDWSEADCYLAQALTLYDSERCPCGCGFPLDESSESDQYEVRKLTCWAKATLEQEEKGDPEPGEIRYLVDMSEEVE